MSKIIVGDLEADGLLSSATTIWCGTFYDLTYEKWYDYSPSISSNYLDHLRYFFTSLFDYDYYLAGHNFISYDIPLIKKILNITIPPERVIDTLVLSKMFFPDIKGHAKPHSIEAWGQRFKIEKPEHEDWSQFSEEMLHRNNEDVRINIKLFELLQQKGFKVP